MSSADLTERLMRSAHRLRRASLRSLAPLGLTPAQTRLLRTLARSDRVWRMGEIAAAMDIVPRSATGLVEALEQAGLVERAVDPSNRRSVLVTLTDQGMAVQREMARARAAAAEELFGPLSADQRATLAQLLDTIAPEEQRG